MHKQTKIGQIQTIHKDIYRFTNLIMFLLVALSNSIPIQAFTGVSSTISQIYRVSVLEVNINSISYFILYVIMILPANYLIDYKGLKTGTMISQICMCFGLTIRCFINISFGYFIVGTFICSFGFCLTISAANKFPNSLLIFVLLISDVIGYFLSTWFINKGSNKEDVLTFFIIQSGIMIVLQILNMIFFRNRPNCPQNYASQKPQPGYLKSIARLYANSNYLFLFFAMTFIFTNLNVLFVGIPRVSTAFNVYKNQWEVGLIVMSIFGFLGCLINSRCFVNKYRSKCIVYLFANFLSHCFLWIGFQTRQVWLIHISFVLIGLSIFPLLITITDYASQCAFPVGEGTSGGSIFFGGHFIGTVTTIFVGFYIGHDATQFKSQVMMIMFLVFPTFSLLFVLLSREDLRRKNFEESKQIDQKVALINKSTYQIAQ